MVKKYKSKDEWKKIINLLTPEEFQDLCYDIIGKNGFINPTFRGGGGDGGRDLEGECVYKIAKEEIREKCWFQCKKQKSGVNFSQISTEVTKAQNQNIKRFFILSNSPSTPACKDDIENWNKTNKCNIIDWSGPKFLDLLFGLPNICKIYFPDEDVPPIIDANNPQRLMNLPSELGKQFGIELIFKINKKINLKNPLEVADAIKENLLHLKGIDINLKSLIYQKISMFFFAIEKHDDALMLLDKSLEITPGNIGALLNKGYILEKIDEIDKSSECYDKILEIDSRNKFALNNKASNLSRMGLFDEALKLINKVLKIDQNFIIAVYNKANILKGLKKSKQSLEFLNKKKDLLPKSISLQTTKVDLLLDLIDLKPAYQINEEILKRDPDHLDAINNKGVIFEKNSKFQKKEKYLPLALESFENLIKKNEKYPLGWSNKTVVLVNSGKIEEAEKVVDSALVVFPNNPYLLNKKGFVLLRKGNPKNALNYFNKTLKFLFQEEFLLNKAEAQLRLRQWKQAGETCDKLLKYNPIKSEAWGFKGYALRHLHQITMAKKCFVNAKKYKEKPISLLE